MLLKEKHFIFKNTCGLKIKGQEIYHANINFKRARSAVQITEKNIYFNTHIKKIPRDKEEDFGMIKVSIYQENIQL